MRILWISAVGSWTMPLAKRIATEDNRVLILVPTTKKENNLINEGNVTIQNVYIHQKDITGIGLTSDCAEMYITYITKFKPDIIHIHGTERNYGQIVNYCHNIPVVVSIQGLVTGYIPFSCNFLKESELKPYRSFKNWFGFGCYTFQEKAFEMRSRKYELDIIKANKYFFCRTNWDKAWISLNNPLAHIFHGEELLRNSFYDNSGKWEYKNCQKFRIFMPAGYTPIKGLHLALKAIAILKTAFPNIELRVPGIPQKILNYGIIKRKIVGDEYINYIFHLIKSLDLKQNVKLLPRLGEQEMANEMLKANVFLSPTSIDNSPNSIGEATMIGVPVVTTPVGGIPSMLRDEESCLFAPAGDVYLMAYQIKRIFNDSELAVKLSKNAHQIALCRHNPDTTIIQYINAYKAIVELHNNAIKKNNEISNIYV